MMQHTLKHDISTRIGIGSAKLSKARVAVTRNTSVDEQAYKATMSSLLKKLQLSSNRKLFPEILQMLLIKLFSSLERTHDFKNSIPQTRKGKGVIEWG